jgi:hypothetical protein
MLQTTSAPRAQLGCAVPRPSPCAAARASLRAQRDTIAQTLRGAPPTGRHVLHVFNVRGLACMLRGSNVPITVEPVRHAAKREQVRAIRPQSPRTCGQPARVWTFKRRAAVCHEPGLSDTPRSCPTRLEAVVRLGVRWRRAKHWMVSPDSASARKNTPRPTNPDGHQAAGPGAGLRSCGMVEP